MTITTFSVLVLSTLDGLPLFSSFLPTHHAFPFAFFIDFLFYLYLVSRINIVLISIPTLILFFTLCHQLSSTLDVVVLSLLFLKFFLFFCLGSFFFCIYSKEYTLYYECTNVPSYIQIFFFFLYIYINHSVLINMSAEFL